MTPSRGTPSSPTTETPPLPPVLASSLAEEETGAAFRSADAAKARNGRGFWEEEGNPLLDLEEEEEKRVGFLIGLDGVGKMVVVVVVVMERAPLGA